MDFMDEAMFKPNLLEILYRIKEAIDENTARLESAMSKKRVFFESK